MCQFCCNEVKVAPFNALGFQYDLPEVPPNFQISGNITNDPYIDGVLFNNYSFRTPTVGQGATVDYTFNSTVNSTAQSSIVTWLNVISRYANLTFTQNANNPDMVFGVVPLGGGINGQAQVPPGTSVQFNSSIDPNLAANGPLWSTIPHEIGHSLGLSHTFGGALNLVPLGLSNGDFSLMSYHSENAQSRNIDRGEYNEALGYIDVKALQYIYGANTTYNAGNTNYDFSSRIVGAIWDSGGIDTFNASSATGAVKIDLRDIGGSPYSSGGWDDNKDAINKINTSKVYIASGAVIENAIGGSGNDKIIGGTAANELYGGNGADTILGGSGGDVIFGGTGFESPNDGNDQIYGGSHNDLIFGNAGNDTIYGDGGTLAVSPNPGNDTIYGGAGNDFLNGEKGFDMIIGGPGNDSLYGGADADLFVFGNDLSGGVNIIYDFQGAGAPGGDVIRILAGANGSGFQTAADVIAAVTTGSGHSYIPVLNSSGQGYAILVGWTTNLTVDDVQVVSAANLLSPSFTVTT